MKRLVLLVALVAAASLAACGSGNAPAPSGSAPAPAPKGAAPTAPAAPAAGGAPSADDTKAALEIFSMRCTPCHGPNGAGDGPASAGLTPKPANFSAPEWQASVTDEHIEKIIAFGGAAVGKSPAMPPNPDLAPKKGVIQALRVHIRSLKK